jgi:hypothetical protein
VVLREMPTFQLLEHVNHSKDIRTNEAHGAERVNG